jgi:hypothetical protein
MKSILKLALAVAMMSGCQTTDKDPDKPDPKPCEGKDIGTVEDRECPAGQAGKHRVVCAGKNGWLDIENTCAAAPEPDPDKPDDPGSSSAAAAAAAEDVRR